MYFRKQEDIYEKRYKALFAALLTGALAAGCLAGCGKMDGTAGGKMKKWPLTKLHIPFFMPPIRCHWTWLFWGRGIDLTLVNGAGADKVMTALISGDAQIGFMGSEASIYVSQEGRTIRQWTLHSWPSGQVISWWEERPSRILNGKIWRKESFGRKSRRYAPDGIWIYLKEAWHWPKTDLTIDQSISFGLTAAAFTSGDADYTVEFEPLQLHWKWKTVAQW